jgi:hypothetical protein
LDETPPATVDNYDGLWRNESFVVNLSAVDDNSGVMETFYKIDDGPTKALSIDGQPCMTTAGSNNTLEYWGLDWAGNEEIPHKFIYDIKLDENLPTINLALYTPSGDLPPRREVKVTANVTDDLSGVQNVALLYTTDDGATWTSLPMMYNASTALCEAAIPGQPRARNGTTVNFQIMANDNAGNTAVEDNSGRLYGYTVHALPGDLNDDGNADLADLVLMAKDYGSKPGDPNWDEFADLAPPWGIIGLTDLVTLACHYGQHY